MSSTVRIFTGPPTVLHPSRPRLESDLEVDVVVVGAGITGVTAALRLAELGKRVVVVEARTLGSGTSSGTTAHITEAVDARYTNITSKFGPEGAKLVASSSREAIEHIARRVRDLEIDCDFERVPGYLYSESADQGDALAKEYDAASRAGLRVELGAPVPLPFPVSASVRFEDQAQFHAGKYLAGLARGAEARGVRIFEESRVLAVEEAEPCMVHMENGIVVRAESVFFATHTPLNRVFLQTKLENMRSYVIALRNLVVASGLYWDTADPYHYMRMLTLDGTPYLLLGGEDHRTGTEENTEVHFEKLVAFARARFRGGDAVYQWSAQLLEPVDGLPFIGRNSLSERVFVATGFSGNGMTFGTLSGLLVADLVAGYASPWASLYSATRVKPIAGAGPFLKHNVEAAAHLIGDRLAPPEVRSLDDIARDEGKTIRIRGERLAVYREPGGRLHALSAVCTHMGCLVKFNHAERTWDCPCHGSRFGIDGAVVTGPATKALARREVHDDEERNDPTRPQAPVGVAVT
jgi:glycine/D-amino acid oxidase-like deaminating enzyme/nitrite reductase/ring-hydroxylating ferredoxin subunit